MFARPLGKRLRAPSPVAERIAPSPRGSVKAELDAHDIDQLMSTEPAFNSHYVDCICVQHTADAEDHMADWLECIRGVYKKNDTESVDAWTALMETGVVGQYWKIAQDFNGPPAYKRKPTSGLDEEEAFFIFFSPQRDGWVLSRTMQNADDEHLVAWFPVPAGFGNMPEVMHMPYWQKQASQLVQVIPQHAFSEATIAELMAQQEARDSGNGDGGAGGAAGAHAITKGSGWREKAAILVLLAP